MKKFLTILLLLATMFPFAAKADQLTVCDGANTNGFVPVFGYYADAYLRAQMVYPASMLADMNGTTISGMKFYATQSSVSWGSTFQVYMAEYPSTTISSFINPTTATTVYTGTLAIAGGEMVVTLDQQFNYAGGNLLIGFDQTTTGAYATSTWKGQNTDGASVQGYSYSSVAGISPTQRNFLPKVTFDYVAPPSLTPADLGQRPNGAWMEPVTVKVGGLAGTVTGMDMDNDYFTFDGPEVPFTTPASFAVTTGTAATGLVEGTLTFMYNDSRSVKQFTMTATAYDPVEGDVVETAKVVANPVGYTNTPTGIYHNYNLPGDASDGADAVYKLTFDSDVMLDANVGNAANGKVALYAEDFNGEAGPMAHNTFSMNKPIQGDTFTEGFENGLNGWTSLDADGDGYGWKLASTMLSSGYGHNGSADFVLSQSYDNTHGVLHPNNYLVSPQKYAICGTSVFSIWACGQSANYCAEHFSIEVSEAGASAADFVTVAEWTIGQRTAKGDDKVRGGSRDQSTWKQYTADLNAYAGKEVWIAIRHFNCSDEFYLDVDDIELSTGSKGEIARGGSSIFSCDFENFLNDHEGWVSIDADGDGRDWLTGTSDGWDANLGVNSTHCIMSQSYKGGTGSLHADNYILTPEFELPAGATITLSWMAAVQDSDWPDTYEVLVAPNGSTEISDFVLLFTDTPDNSNAYAFLERSLDLSDYAGTTVRVVFRHHDYDMFYIKIDNLDITAEGGDPEPGAGMFVPAGTYYLVAQATESFTTHINATAAPAPEQAVIINPTDGMTNVESPVAASWTLGNYTKEMQVLVGSQYPPQDVLIDWTSNLTSSATINDLLPNTTYFMQVNERNDSGETMGEIIGFTTVLNAPAVLEVATSYLYPGDAAMLSWEMNRSFRGYNVYVDEMKVNEALITESEYAVEGLEYGPHTLNVTAVYDEGESAYSNDIEVEMTGFGHVAGAVYEQDSITPIAGAEVKFIGTDAFGFEQTFTFTSANDGTFTGDVYEGSYIPVVLMDGYQETALNEVNVAYESTVDGLTFIVREFFKAPGSVVAEELENNTVNVYWDWNPATLIEDFEHDGEMPEGWNQVGSYGWEITNNAPYEGTYCIKSSNAGIASSTGAIEVTVDVPYEAKMSFYVKPSCESNYDKFFFYIDGVEKFNTSGAGSWTKKEYTVEAGTHTYKWAYTKDSSVNSNDDCIYVDYVTLYEKTVPTPPVVGGTTYDFEDGFQGWTSLDADGDGFGWLQASVLGLPPTSPGHDGSADFVYSQSYDNTYGVLYPDNYLVSPSKLACQAGAQVKLWACGQDASYAAEHFGVAVSTGGATASEFNTIAEWTIGSKGGTRDMAPSNRAAVRGTRDQSEWMEYTADLSAYAGQEVWVAIRHFNVSDQYFLDVDDITLATGGAKMETADNRSFQSYNVYRKNVLTDEMMPIYSTTDTTYIDAQWSSLPAGVYQYGVSATYEGNRGDRAGRSELTVNDGTYYSDHIPVFGYCNDGMQENQFIIPASQIAAMNGSNITSMTFYLSEIGTSSWDNEWNITLMETSATTLSDLMDVTAGTTVTTTMLSGTSSSFTITFDAPFAYNGGNLLVDFESLYAGSWSTARFYGVETSSNTAYFEYYDAYNGIWSEFPESFLPKVTFAYEGGAPVPPVGNEEVTFSFEGGLEGWNVLDVNADGGTWLHSDDNLQGVIYTEQAHTGEGFALCYSFVDYVGAVNTDSYMYTPQKYNIVDGSTFSFWADNANDMYPENFSVCIATADNPQASDFTQIWSGGAKGGNAEKAAVRHNGDRFDNWRYHSIDLSAYAGQEVYIAFHDVNYDAYEIWIDDVTIIYGGAPVPPAPTGDGESEITWSNTLEKGMVVAVDVTVACNNGQSAEGATVKFTNMVEDLIIEGTADAAGIVSFPEFRSGYYTMEIAKAGYATVTEEVEIFEDKSYDITLNEMIAPAEGLFVSATGWVMWENIGGDVPPTPQGDTEFTEDFEGGLGGWTLIDADGDGNNWAHSSNSVAVSGYDYTGLGHNATNGFAYSQSYTDLTYVSFNPDNYLVKAEMFNITNSSTLSFWADNANDDYPDHFGVAVATAAVPTPDDFTVVWDGGAKGVNAGKATVRHSEKRYDNWRHHTIDLSAYAGQNVWIAFRHFNSYDNYEIWIDDVELTTGSKDRSALYSIVMLDGVIAGQATGNWFQLDTDNLVEGQEYEVSVASVYASGMSEWKTTTFTYYSCDNFKPGVKNLAGEVQGVNDVKLTWTLPGGGGSGDEFSFSFDSDLEGWTNIDADGDGHVWYHSNEAANHSTQAVTSHSGAGHVMGESYCNATWAALTPNDFFVTPQQYNIGASSMLSFWACAQDESYAAEHFGVAISTSGNTSASDFTTIAEWTLTAKEGAKGPRATDGSREGAWYEYTCDLSEYAGQAAWIAIRHFNCSDQFLMCLDDISMSNADGKQGNNRAMWDYVASFSGTSAGQQAVATDGEFIYTASWQATPTGGHTFYKYDLEGTFVEGFDISGATGIRDLTYDGEYFYGSSGASQLFILDLANKTMVGTINCSGATSRHCTYDPVRDAFWVGNWSDCALYDRSGAMIQNGPSPSSAYGTGYFQEEDGTEHLYMFCQPNSDALVYDYNITTGQLGTSPIMDFSQTPGFNAGISGGSFVGEYNGKICWFGNAQQDPNLIGIYELAEGQPIIEGDFLGAMIFRDGELITPEPLMAQQMVDYGVEEGEHEYMARLAFGNAEFGVLDTTWYAMSCPVFATVNVENDCTPVNNLAADYEFDAEGTCTVELTWACADATAESFKVYRDGVFIGETTDMMYTDDRTNNPGSYTYGVVAVYAYCESEMVTVDITITDVEENDVVEGIYPNPTTGNLYIKAAAMQQIRVANALGQVMMNETVSGDQTMIDMSAFEAGVYMVSVTTENGTTVKRISVVK